MLGEECACEVNQVGNNLVVAVRPKRRELKRVAGLLALALASLLLLDVVEAGGIGVILGVCAV